MPGLPYHKLYARQAHIEATTLAAIEIECADCHGTPTHYRGAAAGLR